MPRIETTQNRDYTCLKLFIAQYITIFTIFIEFLISLFTVSLASCSVIELCRHLTFSETSAAFFRELGNELYRRFCQNEDFSEKAGAAAVWSYCLSELLIFNSTPPPELATLRSQTDFDIGAFDFHKYLKINFDKATSVRATRQHADANEVSWFKRLPFFSPRLSLSHPPALALRPSQRIELIKVYSNKYTSTL